MHSGVAECVQIVSCLRLIEHINGPFNTEGSRWVLYP